MRTLNFPLSIDGHGELVTVTGLEALRQKINQRLSLFKGSWFLNITAGIPYFQEIIKKPVDPGLVASILNQEILKEPDVLSIGEVEADLNPETRKFSYRAVPMTVYGPTEVII